ncbi:MAG: carboxypeptidase regulatory-like domain-containing protein [Alphaproteobacteria bacterium]|nr:carboxypeptidase regulatory-like domain-containing protein [Alphaproteobacteria bacterium]
MKPLSIRTLSAALVPVAGAGLLVALTTVADARTTLPPEQSSGVAHYVSGGIGADESSAMKQAASRYPLELVFAQRDGASRGDYLAGVPVTIRDNASGKVVLNATAKGPYLLANLPDGTYKVSATVNGVSKQQLAHLASGAHQRIVFEW